MGDQYSALTRWRRSLRVSVWFIVALASSVCASQGEASPRLVWRLAEDARGIPARDAQSVYFLTQRHELMAASVSSGRVRWRVPTDSTGATFGSRVIVEGDMVVAGDYDLIGVDRRTGQQRWRFAPDDGGGTAIHLGDARGGVAFAGSLTGTLHAVDIETGRQRWAVSVGDAASTTVYSPVVSGSWVAASFTDFGPRAAGGVVVADVRTGAVRWRRTVPGSIGASGNPVFAGGAVVVASRDGTLYAFDAGSGKVTWTWPRVEQLRDEQDYRPLAVSGRIVLAGSLSGEVAAHDVMTRKVLWRRAPVVASVAFDMAAHNGVLFVPYLSGQIVALRVHDGVELWRLADQAASFRWLPLVDGPLVFASGSRSLTLYRRDGWSARGWR